MSQSLSQLQAVGIPLSIGLSALGQDIAQIRQHLIEATNTLSLDAGFLADRAVWVGRYAEPLIETIPESLGRFDSRNLRFALTALQKIETELQQQIASIDLTRLSIVMGTSTSGISDSELLLKQHFDGNDTIEIMHQPQEMGCLAKALQVYLGWQGAAYTISTACSSSAKAFAAGQRLIQAGLADAVLVGGVDTLCQLTLNGFNSLESLSADICQPCGINRDGINIGEAAALFLLTKATAPIMLYGVGESMDAWHISAPHPEGLGAANAMQRALDSAAITAQQVGYINLHGTATQQNDAMEIKAVRQVFQGLNVPLSSTKHKTGHCLGAAGAIEAFICTQLLKDQNGLPLHQQTDIDPELADQNYVTDARQTENIRYVLSNSFAFGGSNISLLFGVQH
ncbi:beta-ketoacyl-[acyl-carrier-protein] synthase family protein [Acinetobacter genomosp. 15BJ]|uniref:3-oxoacyl-[acyl-carrier-protein] synthase I n=1 Tax=Acinetobacter genomosp. 15BJ TaxID=106651 RepID=R9B5R8_9GAMM|nr:beta-ketoacyl-[acyl-carrier-protein] synthase family protein [Acinetobacter genomosp. 15BJ]EOR09635.1 3-oxoacyl-[acyl-carrier-protein] synthase I [Acinetobacter genomosp. 15BJ]MCH7293059.1 beta-ketoacyl-[acyl-carrier-protein] synthase family protein [Acinetobacter genomosp. 15BJ]MDO3657164.1 beta-ketoacyl-[acyl-carrier-protein] synthase family protein [Acinetobacter genomosp. 15BJ]